MCDRRPLRVSQTKQFRRRRSFTDDAVRGEVRDARSRRAPEYAAHLGSKEAVHPADRQLVSTWADQIEGPAIDAGCGPGHWTNYLAERGVAMRGVAVRGIDCVPEFIAQAQATYPGIPSHLGVAGELPAETGAVGGVGPRGDPSLDERDDRHPLRIRWFERGPFGGH